jgi:hypothetical protein
LLLLLLQFFSGSFLLSHLNLKSYNLTEVAAGEDCHVVEQPPATGGIGVLDGEYGACSSSSSKATSTEGGHYEEACRMACFFWC